MTAKTTLEQAVVALTAHDLTPHGDAFCPHPKAGMATWNTHPKVFIKLENGVGKCPYCGTAYAAEGGAAGHH